MSPGSAVFTDEEIVRLHDMLTAFESSTRGASSSASSVVSLIEQEILRLRCLLAAFSDSSPSGSAGSATDPSGIMRPPSTQAGTSSWILHTGASFHMTHDSSTLSSLRSLDSPVHVRTADGTSLPVHGRSSLSTSSFIVPHVAHVPRLTMQLISGG